MMEKLSLCHYGTKNSIRDSKQFFFRKCCCINKDIDCRIQARVTLSKTSTIKFICLGLIWQDVWRKISTICKIMQERKFNGGPTEASTEAAYLWRLIGVTGWKRGAFLLLEPREGCGDQTWGEGCGQSPALGGGEPALQHNKQETNPCGRAFATEIMEFSCLPTSGQWYFLHRPTIAWVFRNTLSNSRAST